MRTGDREQGSGFRGSWVAALALVLAAGCASPQAAQFADADWVSHATTGRGAYERGDYRRGADAYGRAQQRARALDDAEALAVAAVNRATCLLAADQADEALAGADEALGDPRVSTARRAELMVAGARAEVALGKIDEALARLEAALALAPAPVLRAQALLARGAAELAREQPGAAEKALSEGMSAEEWERLPASLRAERTALLAQIAAAEKKPAEAAVRQDEAAALWKKAGRLPDMARALAEGGRQAQAAKDWAGACDRFYRAARSLWAQGLRPEAVRALEEGISCAEKLDDEAVGKRMADLFVTFQDGERLEK
ncbi:MAG: hypothetical protein AB7V14_06760 [Kiritimatiellia bacterium]